MVGVFVDVVRELWSAPFNSAAIVGECSSY